MPKNWSCLLFFYMALTFICFILGAAFLRSLRISLSSIFPCLSGSSISLMRSFNSLRLRSRSSAARSAKEKKDRENKFRKKNRENIMFCFREKNRENETVCFLTLLFREKKNRENVTGLLFYNFAKKIVNM